jgi:hypothetical protein
MINFKSEELHEKYSVVTWILGTISAFTWKQTQMEAKKSLAVMASRRQFRILTS